MSKYIPGNQKHLTLNDRIYIENELSKGTTFKDIAAFLCKDPTTISKEVKSRRLSDWYHKGTFYNATARQKALSKVTDLLNYSLPKIKINSPKDDTNNAS